MALEKLTKIDGGGISTTSDYRVGVITATKFVGPIEGSITSTDATFSGNVSIGGTLTYEDVTNIDSVGLITARNGIEVSTGTATTALVVNGDARVTGILTVGTGSLTLDGPNNLVNVGTALTLGHTQGLQFHTQNLHSAGFEVNQINVSGVSTFSSNVDVNANIHVRNLILDGNNGIKYIDADLANDNSITFRGYVGNNYQNMADFTRGGACGLNFSGNRKLETSNTGITVTGTAVATGADINGDLDVDGHANLDNVSVAGITTHNEDVLFTTANGGNILIDKSDNSIRLGQSVGLFYGTNKMWMQHNGSVGYLHNVTGSLYIRNEDSSGDIYIQGKSGEHSIICNYDGNVQLYNDGTIRFNTTSTGVTVHGSSNPDLKIRQGASSNSGSGFLAYENVDGNGQPRSIAKIEGKTTANGGYGELNFQTQFNNTLSTRWTIDHTGHLVPGSAGAVNIGSASKEIGDVYIADDKKLYVGSDQNISLYHTSSNSINHLVAHPGNFMYHSATHYFTNAAQSQVYAQFIENSYCELRHSGNIKFRTSSSGITVTGTAVADGISVGDGEHISLGNSNQFKLYHDGSNAALQTTSGNTYLYGGGGNFLIRPVNAKQGLNVIANGAVELFHNDVKVCTTTTEGIRVQGAEGGGGKVEIYADEGDDNADKWHLLANTDGTLLIRNLSDGSWDTNIKLSSTSTELYADDSKKLETTSTGIEVTGKVTANHSNGQVVLQSTDGSIELTRTAGSAYIDFKNSTSEDYDARLNEEGGAFRVNTHFRLYDNKALELGNRTGTTYGDLRLYHDTSNSIIEGFTGSLNIRNYDTNSTNINISARNNILLQTNLNETAIQCVANGAVELFHDSGTYGTAKLQTTTTGIKINGDSGGLALNVVNGYIRSVGGTPTVVAHKSSSTFCHIGVEGNTNARAFLAYTNDKDFIIGRRTAYTGDHTGYSGRDISIDKTNHAVDICYDGNTRFATTNTGVQVTGDIGCTSDLILDSTNTDHPRIEMHSNATGITKYAIINGQAWNPDALLIYDLDADNTRLTIESSGLGINRGANSISHGLDVGGNAIIRGNTEITGSLIGDNEITGRLTLSTSDTGISFGPGAAANDMAHIEWKGGNNAGYLRISTDDDSDVGSYEYIEFGDYQTGNRGGTFTQHCRIKRDEFLIKTGGSSGTADRFKVDIDGLTHAHNGITVAGITTATLGFAFGSGGHYLYQGASDTVNLRVTSNGPYAEFKDVSGDLQIGSASGTLRLSTGGAMRAILANTYFQVDGDIYMSGELNLTNGGNKNRFIDSSMDSGEALFLRSTINGDASHQNMALFHREGSVNLYHANSEKFATQAHGINVYGDIHMGGLSNTTTNQSRQIYWTGFDKEGTTDFSDYAHIKHLTNVHGITGSVLEIRAENDVNDGIALHASSGNGIVAAVCKKFDVSGYIEPSYGSGDNGIKWQPDPAGGSGDIATMQYYADGSGENLRLRILVANDGDDDLFLEAPGGVYVQGTLGAQTKNFRIPHVLPGLTTTTDLIHSSVESPQADNIYRGRTKLVAGISTVNIDTTNNMTDGTFVNLNRDVQCFTTNETGWTNVKGSVTGNLLTIIAQDNACTDTISWMVIGERWDLAMYNPDNPSTDENGKIKTEMPNRNYAKGYNEDYINENKLRVGISTISRPSIENKEVE